MKQEKGQQQDDETTTATIAESVSPAQDFGEAEQSEAAEQPEATKQLPEDETGDLEVSDISSESELSMAAESATEKLPEQEQIDGFRPADEDEQPQP